MFGGKEVVNHKVMEKNGNNLNDKLPKYHPFIILLNLYLHQNLDLYKSHDIKYFSLDLAILKPEK